MALEIKQSLRMSQQLVVTPQLQQAIRLLQLSRLELATLIQKELTDNPCLEELDEESETARLETEDDSRGEQHAKAKEEDKGHEHLNDEVGSKDGEMKEPPNFDWENYIEANNAQEFKSGRGAGKSLDSEELPTYENVLRQSETLQDHLYWQLGLSQIGGDDFSVAEEIIGNINDDGYLMASLDEIAGLTNTNAVQVEEVLKKIQAFDPPGIGARNVQECLLLQCKQLIGENAALLTQMIEEHLEDLEKHDYKKIGRRLNIPIEKVLEMEKMVHQLDPKPGRAFSNTQPQYITPDVFIHKRGEEYIIVLNEDGLPKLTLSALYRKAILSSEGFGDQAKDYIQEKLRQALWLIKSIHQRQRTLYRVTQSIVKFQKEFFDNGVASLRPMVLKDVAEDINMHESTISRVTTNKYVHTPRGLFELKYFFNSSLHSSEEGDGIASEVVKEQLQKLISQENASKPLSDQAITKILKAQHHVDIARRTVAKYREMLGILPSSRRRRRV